MYSTTLETLDRLVVPMMHIRPSHRPTALLGQIRSKTLMKQHKAQGSLTLPRNLYHPPPPTSKSKKLQRGLPRKILWLN